MYERVTKLLEAELLRSNTDEQHSVNEEHKDGMSLPWSTSATRPETSASDKSVLDATPQQEEKM